MQENLYVIQINREDETIYPYITISIDEPKNLQTLPKIPFDPNSNASLNSVRTYWRYSANRFYQIFDFLSFQTFMLLSNSKVIYAVFDTNIKKSQSEALVQFDCHLIKKVLKDKSGIKITSTTSDLNTTTSMKYVNDEVVNSKFLEGVKQGFKIVVPATIVPMDIFPHLLGKKPPPTGGKKKKK